MQSNKNAMIKSINALRINHYVFIICFGAKREETSWLDAKRFDKWRPWYAPV